MSWSRVPLILALVLAAMLYLVSVTAFKGAVVTDPTSFTVVATDTAGLALTPGPGNAANQAGIAGQILQIDFRNGFGGGPHSLQPDSTVLGVSVTGDDIRMRRVFTVTNNGGDCQDVSVYVTSGGPSHLRFIYGRLPATAYPGTQLAITNGSRVAGASVKLGTPATGSNQMYVDFWWQATTTAIPTAGNFTVQVSGVKSATCP